MVAQASPINPLVLSWAVGEDGRDLLELADALAVDVDLVAAWIEGRTLPTRGEVSRVAEVLRRPRALFFLPAAPSEASMPPSFRHPPGGDREAGPRSLRAFRRARRVQQAVAWTLSEQVTGTLPQAVVSDSAEKSAGDVRAWLGVSDADQSTWKDDREALAAWRTALDERDILVFQFEIGEGEVRGFSAWDPVSPMIATNSSGVTPPARIFTLAHELGHLALRRDAACVEAPPNEATSTDEVLERWCEEFAGALLMPPAAVRGLMRDRGVDQASATIDDVKATMLRFRVSARAAALRLIDLKFAPRALYAEVLRVFVPKPRTEKTKDFRRQARSKSRVREYGVRALRTVLTSVPETDAMSILRVNAVDVRELADLVPGVHSF